MESIDDNLLSDTELVAYLAEIERDDDELAQQDDEAQAAIIAAETIADVTLTKSDTAAVAEFNKEAHLLKVKRRAFSQTKLELSRRIADAHFKLLISLLTKPHTKVIEQYEQYLNKRLERALLRQMPAVIRRCWREYPKSLRAYPSFKYVVKDKFRNYVFYATPNLPIFFEQHTERDILLAKEPKTVQTLDKAVKKYYDYKHNKSKREIDFATTLVRNNIKTYFDLVKIKPLMFELLYNHLFGELE